MKRRLLLGFDSEKKTGNSERAENRDALEAGRLYLSVKSPFMMEGARQDVQCVSVW